MAEERIDYTQWLKRGTSTFVPTDNAKTVGEVEPGVYNLRWSDNIGFHLFKRDLKLDELVNLQSKEGEEVLDVIQTFWQRQDKFKDYGFVYKRGVLLYGPPGSGKTSIINLLSQKLMEEMNGVVFILQSYSDLKLYRSYIPEVFRIIEPNRPIITVIEDIDGICEYHEAETVLINILDGIEQLENVVYLATTNYTERLSSRLLNRPNRFDRRIHIGYPDAKTRYNYIKFKLKEDDLKTIDMKLWIKETKNFTIAHLGELIKSVIILGNDFDETVKTLRELSEVPHSHDYNKDNEKATLGFGNKTHSDEEYEVEVWDVELSKGQSNRISESIDVSRRKMR